MNWEDKARQALREARVYVLAQIGRSSEDPELRKRSLRGQQEREEIRRARKVMARIRKVLDT